METRFSPFVLMFLMNFLFWNSRGVGNKTFPRLLKEISGKYNVSFVALAKNRVSGARTDGIIRRCCFEKSIQS